MLRQIDRVVVLELVAVVAQLVIRRERLEPERRVVLASLKNLHLGKPRRGDVLAALPARCVAGGQGVGHPAAGGGVPLAPDRADGVPNGGVPVGGGQGNQSAPSAPPPQGGGGGDED